jgi:hypothetical protein
LTGDGAIRWQRRAMDEDREIGNFGAPYLGVRPRIARAHGGPG